MTESQGKIAIAICVAILALGGIAVLIFGGEDQKASSAIDGDPSTTIPAELASLKPPPERDPNTPLPEQDNVTDVTDNLGEKPVGKISGDKPDELTGQDVVVGTGAVAKKDTDVEVQYVGQLFDGGTEFDTSWTNATTPGKPFKFWLGEGLSIIKGWDQGIPGMKVGGRRILVIPPDLAYGAPGSPPKIPADATLVFTIDLKKVTPHKTTTTTKATTPK